MASSTKKITIKGHSYWFFRFSNKHKRPKEKKIYFSADRHKKSEVDSIRDTLERKYRGGEWDPWTQPVPDLHSSTTTDVQLSKAVTLLEEYIEGKYADNTIDSIKQIVNQFSKDAGDLYLSRITTDQINAFINDVASYHSRRTRKDRVKVLIKFCVEKGFMDHIDIDHLKAFGSRKEKNASTRRFITEPQMFSMLDAMDAQMREKSSHRKVSLRRIQPAYQKRKDIIQVLFYMGLRLDEIVHCRPAWIMDDFRFLRIGDLKRWRLNDEFHPKSQKETDRPIAIPPEVTEIFKRRIGSCDGMYDRLFGMRSNSHVRRAIKEACKGSDQIEHCRGISPHALRHSCASYWLNDRGVPIQEVQNLLRHANINITMTYFHPDSEAHYRAFHGGRIVKLDGTA